MENRDIGLNASAGQLSLIPLFYVAWADSILSPSEMTFIHQKLDGFSFLSESDKAYFKKFTDPQNPPPPELFKTWIKLLKYASKELRIDEKISLAELGITLARKSNNLGDAPVWESDETKNAIQSLENALGISTRSSSFLLNHALSNTIKIKSQYDTSFNIHELKRLLDGEDWEMKDKMRRLLLDPQFHKKHIPDNALHRKRVLEQLKSLATQGLGNYAFPKEYGGKDENGSHISIFEMLAYGDLSLAIKFGVQFGLFGGALFGLGTERHFKKYLKSLGEAELLGCFAMTETGHGSNVKGLQTTATYNHQDGTIVINSPTSADGKEYIGNALDCQMAAVFAQLIVNGENHGVHAILVPMRNDKGDLLAGIKVEDCGYKMGLNGVDNGKIWFNNVRVPKENLLNKFGDIDETGQYTSQISNPSRRFFTMLGALVTGRICVGMLGNNASKKALKIAIEYGLSRRQFSLKEGDEEMLIMDYPSHQQRLIPRLAKTYACHFSLASLANKFIKPDHDVREIETIAAGLKAYATWHTTDTIQECREACGGKGYLSENAIPALKADTDIFATFEGDNTVLMQLVAKGLLSKFQKSFHDEGFRAVIRYLGDRISATLTEINPYYSRNTDFDHLTDFNFFKHAFEYRLKKLLISLSQRMRDYLKKGIKAHQAFLKCQIHMIELAHAYIENLILHDFIEATELDMSGKSKEVLSILLQIFALDTIEKHRGWYLENDYMEGEKSKAIRRTIQKLYQQIRPDLQGLVDSFGIPAPLVNAEILK